MEKKKLIAPGDALILLLLAAAAAALFFWLDAGPRAVTAVIEREGGVVLTQDLTALEGPIQTVVEGANGHRATIELSPQGARFLSSTCPDKTCVRTGAISHAGETALCLPARVSLRLEGAGGGFDAVTY